MVAIPEDEADLIPIPTFISMDTRYIVEEWINPMDIGVEERKLNKPSALRCIWRGETERAEDLIMTLARENKWDKGF